MPDPSEPSPPRLRGLDPAGLLGVLGGARERPIIPGWEIAGVLGEGGLGLVWKARRISDSMIAAVKVPRGSEHLERLESEARVLAALDHPHIVRLLGSGALGDSGFFLAMEYIDGPALAHALPQGGFTPKRALALFHEIASAVAYAHERKIIHRDLKPGNILLDAAGRAHVADFGLARPVHERVQHLSLTHTGLIAGTAEYLPPEAYRAGYVPGVAGDVYALGVILHELLTGAPPRGAWREVSQQKRCDIRLDDVLRRALAPDPAERWTSVSEMAAALREIERTPPRYAGTPRLTPAVRVADTAWTLLGLFVLVAALGVAARVAQWRGVLPLDLVGDHGRRVGAVQAVCFLLPLLVPGALWQLARLWRFRGVPLREALPAPFGLKLGGSRTAAALVLGAQLACLLAPTLLLADTWRRTGREWIGPDVPAWRAGLAIVPEDHHELIDPWAWPARGKHYWLVERQGLPDDPLGRQLDRIDFTPGLVPWAMSACAAALALGLGGTLALAIARWWPVHRARALTTLGGACALGVITAWPRAVPPETPEEKDLREHEAMRDERRHLTRFSDEIIRALYATPPPDWERVPEDLLRHYAAEVEYYDQGRLPREDYAARVIERELSEARAQRRTVEILGFELRPNSNPRLIADFENRAALLEYTDPPSGEATATYVVRVQRGLVLPGRGLAIQRDSPQRHALYRAEPRTLPAVDARQWAARFLAALNGEPGADALDALFTPRLVLTNDGWRAGFRDQRLIDAPEYAALLRTQRPPGTQLTLSDPPGKAEMRSGARQHVHFGVRESGGREHRWSVELVFTKGGWQAVRLAF
jgi:predicted Ser/Thr protein kinase